MDLYVYIIYLNKYFSNNKKTHFFKIGARAIVQQVGICFAYS